jgi:hypothetical protein
MNIFTRFFYYFLNFWNHYFYSIEKKLLFIDSDEEEEEDINKKIEKLSKQNSEKVNETLELKEFIPLPETETTNFEEKDDSLPDLISEEIREEVTRDELSKDEATTEVFCQEKKEKVISSNKEEDAIVLQKQESKQSIVLEKKESVKSEHIVDKNLSKKWWVCF